MTAADFTWPAYRDLLSAFRERGYEVRAYDTAEPSARHLILRHDLDMSLKAALPIAEIEADLAISATYFVLLRTEMYNPHSPEAGRCLRRLIEFGHDIGLHFDAALYPDDPTSLDDAAGRECAILEQIVGQPVAVISFHRPAKPLLGHVGRLAGRRHAYEPVFFEEMGYCSDSRGGWHHGHPLDHPAVAAGRAVQILTHPIWWTEHGDIPQRRLDGFLASRMETLDEELARHCSIHIPRRERQA